MPDDQLRALRRAHHRRRALARAGGERFTLREIAERDGWVCQLCGEPVPRVVGPRSGWVRATLDHVVPLGHGGTHMRGNVRLAHARCNEVRGPRWGSGPLPDGHPRYQEVARQVRRYFRRREAA